MGRRGPRSSDGDAAGVAIRPLRADEWQALREIRLRALVDAPDAFGGTYEDAAADPADAWQARTAREGTILLVAERAGRLVGMASGGRAPTEDPMAELHAMWVEPAERGTGLAAAMVEEVVGWARSAGYPAIGLGVTTTNARAIALYARLGFTDLGLRMPLREGSEHVIQVMTRRLD